MGAVGEMRALVERVLRDSEAQRRAARELADAHDRLVFEVRRVSAPVRREAVRERLRAVPVARLRQVADGPFRLGPVHGAELVSVADVLDSTPGGLRLLRGVGPVTAGRLHEAATRLAEAANLPTGLRIEIGRRDGATMPLVAALHPLVNAGRDLPRARAFADLLNGIRFGDADELRRKLGWRRLFWPRWQRRKAVEEFVVRKDLLEHPDGPLLTLPDLLGPHVPDDAAWRDFERRPDDYRAALADAVRLNPYGRAAEGFLTGEAAVRVAEQPLDGALLRVPLRDYQSFGARFALARRRVILGDEAVLGTAVQAIAAMAHRRAEGVTRFLVACPGGVLLNWVRDIEAYSSMPAHPLQGPDQSAARRRWTGDGGVAVVPLETLADQYISPDLPVGMFVLDEAHRVRNPDTARARAVAAWSDRVDDVLFLTGVPLEERIGDFRTLCGLLGSRESVRPEDAALGVRAFRAAVAPVYLRREWRDVLAELPDVVDATELVAFSRADRRAYRDAADAGDFTAMRRAAYAVPKTSAKLRRLRALAGEAAADGRKVVVLSCFPEVLDTVRDALGTLAPVTSGTSPDRRREIADAFAAAPGHVVLPVEIGVDGFDPRGASMVIVCEPQEDEDLAAGMIGRVHGDGPLPVHRLVAPGTVDERVADDPARVIEDEQSAAF